MTVIAGMKTDENYCDLCRRQKVAIKSVMHSKSGFPFSEAILRSHFCLDKVVVQKEGHIETTQ